MSAAPEPRTALHHRGEVYVNQRLGGGGGRLLVFVAKALVSAGLVYWMAQGGRLSGADVGVLLDSPILAGATLASWVVVTLGLSTFRWLLLLRSYGVRISAWRAGVLQMMGLFLNIVVPGNVSGDVIKNLHVPHRSLANVAMIALTERLMGLVALIWIAWAVSLFDLSHVMANAKLRLVLFGLSGVVLLSVAVPPLLVRWARRRPSAAPAPSARRLIRLVSAFTSSVVELGRSGLGTLGGAFASSLALHGGNLFYFFLIARTITNPTAPVAAVALVYPLGMLTMILPVSISGLGVGHAAFQELFSWVGLVEGANTFNVFIVGVLGPCMLGVVPTLLLRRAPRLPAAEPQTQKPPEADVLDGGSRM